VTFIEVQLSLRRESNGVLSRANAELLVKGGKREGWPGF